MEVEMGVPIILIESYEVSIIVVFDMLSDETISKKKLIELQSQKLSEGLDLGFPIVEF